MLKYQNNNNLAYKGYEKYSIAREKRPRASPIQDMENPSDCQILKIEATGNALGGISQVARLNPGNTDNAHNSNNS